MTPSAPGFRAVMILGASLTIGVWGFAGIFFGGRVAQIQAQAQGVSQRYLRAQRLLTEARNQVLLSSVYVREALLDPAEPFVSDSAARMASAFDTAEDNLAQYVPILDSTYERERVDRLRSEIRTLRQEMDLVLATDRTEWPVRAGQLLRERLIPKRESVIRVADELGTLNRTAFVEHQVQTVAIYRETQSQIWSVLGLALAASLGIAGLAAVQAGRLERRVRDQQVRDAEMQDTLHRLSSSLIKVREDERRAIARELHDEIGQMLTAVKVELSVADRAAGDRVRAIAALEDGRRIVDRALQAVRDLSRLLHPTMLDDLGLVAAVDWQVKGFRSRHDLDVQFTHEGLDERLPPDLEIATYRIVQEALTNVAKHAGAAVCSVSLSRRADRLLVEISDDGRGVSSDAGSGGQGLGLISMRERTAQLGGTMVIESGPGLGTRIVFDLPVASTEERARQSARGDV